MAGVVLERVPVDHVGERDRQSLTDLEGQLGWGDEETERAFCCAVRRATSKVSKWQEVIHGDTGAYRLVVVDGMLERREWKRARRFALCGRGDVVRVNTERTEARVGSRGCGLRFCPRCSRRAGTKSLRKVMRHLGEYEHGDIWHLVLTQRVLRGEPLERAKARFDALWKRFYPKLKACKVRSALVTYHVKRSRANSWHYHAHAIVEFDPREDGDEAVKAVKGAWGEAVGDKFAQDLWGRRVTKRGPAMSDLTGEKQMEFWAEAESETARVLQYAIRDVLQGVEAWCGNMSELGGVQEFVKVLDRTKLHRLYGEWRKKKVEKGEVEVGVELPRSTVPLAKEKTGWWELGTVEQVVAMAQRGVEECRSAIRLLVSGSRNSGRVALRLRRALEPVVG